MNVQQKSLLLSIILHGIAGCVIYMVNSNFVQPVKTIVIDLTVSTDDGPGRESHEKSVNTPLRRVSDRRKPVLEKPRAATHAEPERVRPKVQDRASAQPVESSGPASVLSGQRQGPSAPVTAAAAASASDNADETAFSASGAHAGMPAASGGSGNSAEQLKNGYLKEHFAYIKEIIQRNITYPSRARRMGWFGRVVVSFVINENGRASNEKILESSGFDVLDSNVIATIRAISPFPRPPVKAELRVPIVYRLE